MNTPREAKEDPAAEPNLMLAIVLETVLVADRDPEAAEVVASPASVAVVRVARLVLETTVECRTSREVRREADLVKSQTHMTTESQDPEATLALVSRDSTTMINQEVETREVPVVVIDKVLADAMITKIVSMIAPLAEVTLEVKEVEPLVDMRTVLALVQVKTALVVETMVDRTELMLAMAVRTVLVEVSNSTTIDPLVTTIVVATVEDPVEVTAVVNATWTVLPKTTIVHTPSVPNKMTAQHMAAMTTVLLVRTMVIVVVTAAAQEAEPVPEVETTVVHQGLQTTRLVPPSKELPRLMLTDTTIERILLPE